MCKYALQANDTVMFHSGMLHDKVDPGFVNMWNYKTSTKLAQPDIRKLYICINKPLLIVTMMQAMSCFYTFTHILLLN